MLVPKMSPRRKWASPISEYSTECDAILLCYKSSGILTRSNKKIEKLKVNTGLFEMIVGVLTTCHTQCT